MLSLNLTLMLRAGSDIVREFNHFMEFHFMRFHYIFLSVKQKCALPPWRCSSTSHRVMCSVVQLRVDVWADRHNVEVSPLPRPAFAASFSLALLLMNIRGAWALVGALVRGLSGLVTLVHGLLMDGVLRPLLRLFTGSASCSSLTLLLWLSALGACGFRSVGSAASGDGAGADGEQHHRAAHCAHPQLRALPALHQLVSHTVQFCCLLGFQPSPC